MIGAMDFDKEELRDLVNEWFCMLADFKGTQPRKKISNINLALHKITRGEKLKKREKEAIESFLIYWIKNR